MEQLNKSVREEIIETANKLFNYTDARNWQGLLTEVFTDTVWFDMSSVDGSRPDTVPAVQICEAWKNGFSGIDAVHHQAGNYVADIRYREADLFCYATATHYRKSESGATIHTFVGSYELHFMQFTKGWKVSRFVYRMKFMDDRR